MTTQYPTSGAVRALWEAAFPEQAAKRHLADVMTAHYVRQVQSAIDALGDPASAAEICRERAAFAHVAKRGSVLPAVAGSIGRVREYVPGGPVSGAIVVAQDCMRYIDPTRALGKRLAKSGLDMATTRSLGRTVAWPHKDPRSYYGTAYAVRLDGLAVQFTIMADDASRVTGKFCQRRLRRLARQARQCLL